MRREASGVQPPAGSAKREPPQPVSWSGVAGGVLGFLILVALAALVAGGASDRSALWSLPLAAFSGVWLAAAAVSVRPVTARRGILRLIVIGSLVAGLIGVVPYGAYLLVVMAPPLSLLATAAGFIFQGGKAAR